MTDKRVVILTDGRVTIGGVVCKLVPVEPTPETCNAIFNAIRISRDSPAYVHAAMLSAAAIDLRGLPRVPERLPDASVNLTDTIERIAFKDGRVMGFNEALDAMGIK